MRVAIIIPARFQSKRFPGKPLALISGIPLLQRVWNIAQKAGADEVCVATDDQKIYDLVKSFSGQVVMTNPACKNGSERVLEAARQLSKRPDVVVNLQGDAVLTPPWILSALISEMKSASAPTVATPAVRLTKAQLKDLQQAKSLGNTGGTLVVFDDDHNALYFSRSIIPFERTEAEGELSNVYRHIGLYAYTFSALEKYVSLPESRLEKIEKLEQLRLLENKIPLKVVEVDYKGRTHCSVDTPEDAKKAEEIIAKEGELF